jgi:NAD(P)H-hydrate epimerase
MARIAAMTAPRTRPIRRPTGAAALRAGEAWAGAALLTVSEMAAADRAAMAAGVSGPALMEAAGAAVAREAMRRWPGRPVSVLSGPGNNGGDGFVAARLLAESGRQVRLGLLGPRERLKGDAAGAAGGWTGAVEPMTPAVLGGAGLVIDALFGAGLDRPIDGDAKAMIAAVAASGLPVLAVDVPSGVAGNSGTVLGTAAPASATVTFTRPKPGHVLLPGRALCGDLLVADIGIPQSVLGPIAPKTALNRPALWRHFLPAPRPTDHKYSRGHVIVLAGRMTGAARLAALGAARAGAGMVTVLAERETLPILAAALPAAIVVRADGAPSELAAFARDRRAGAMVVGPGLGLDRPAYARVAAALDLDIPVVVDADALTLLEGQAAKLGRRAAPTVLTPHDGEFARLFGADAGSRLDRARAGAVAAGAVVVLKGYDTVVADPDGTAVVNDNAPARLATAGAGDVLAGALAALLAGGMPAFAAAAAAVWLHGRAAEAGPPGLIADDLPAGLAAAHAALTSGRDQHPAPPGRGPA